MTFSRTAIEAILTGQRQPSFLVNVFLTWLSKRYGTGVKLRRSGYACGILKSKTLPCAVISIGNLSTGGTGKTPMAIYTAEHVRQMGYRVAVISRGYKGSAEKHGGIVSDEDKILMDPKTAGDEPFLLASSLPGIPVLVGHNRYQSGMLAIKRFQTQVVILDDAFQHLALFRDMNVVLLDRTRPFGNGHLLPRGTLREPVSALKSADALILTRSTEPFDIPADSWATERPVFFAAHEPFLSARFLAGETLQLRRHVFSPETETLVGKRFFAFSGIADNPDFHRTLEKLGVHLIGTKEFSDHHAYTSEDIRNIVESAVHAGATALVTTEKDLARLHGRFHLPMECAVVGIRISLNDPMAFDRLIQNRISLSA